MRNQYRARVLCLTLTLFFLAGCWGQDTETALEEGWPVYYASVWAPGEVDRILDSRAVAVQKPADPLPELLTGLLAEPEDEKLTSAFPPGTKVDSYAQEDGLLTLYLSGGYENLSGWALSLADACAVLTLGNVPGVHAVRLMVAGEPQGQRPDRTFSVADFITDDLTLKPVERQLTLYFIDAYDQTLAPELRPVFIRENEAAERYVMEELFAGPKTTGLNPLIDFEVNLMSAVTENGVCHVNLPSVFYETPPLAPEALTLEAIVNSLTELPGVEAVQFLQDGDTPPPYGGQALDKPLARKTLAGAP